MTEIALGQHRIRHSCDAETGYRVDIHTPHRDETHRFDSAEDARRHFESAAAALLLTPAILGEEALCWSAFDETIAVPSTVSTDGDAYLVHCRGEATTLYPHPDLDTAQEAAVLLAEHRADELDTHPDGGVLAALHAAILRRQILSWRTAQTHAHLMQRLRHAYAAGELNGRRGGPSVRDVAAWLGRGYSAKTLYQQITHGL